jgi:hypothetical protein
MAQGKKGKIFSPKKPKATNEVVACAIRKAPIQVARGNEASHLKFKPTSSTSVIEATPSYHYPRSISYDSKDIHANPVVDVSFDEPVPVIGFLPSTSSKTIIMNELGTENDDRTPFAWF